MSSDNHLGKLFVTGGNGFIGSYLLPLLIENGYSIKCLLRETSNTKRIEHLSYEYTVGDIRDSSCLAEGIKGCQGVIHLAAIANWANIASPHVHEVIVEGTNNVLKTAKKYGNLKTVYVSSAAAVGGTKRPNIQNESEIFNLRSNRYAYVLAKVEAEKLCQQYAAKGLPIVTVNPTEVYGPGDTDLVTAETLIKFAKSKPVLITKGGTSIVHAEDVAQGILAAYKQGEVGERYILGGDNLNFHELAALTLEILKTKKPIINVPHIFVKLYIFLSHLLKLRRGINSAALEYALLYWFMDNSKAQRELGIQFRSARDTLAPTLKWLQEMNFIPGDEHNA